MHFYIDLLKKHIGICTYVYDYFLVADTFSSGQSASFAYCCTVMTCQWPKLSGDL
jgi:hypothetical protein